MTTGTPPNSGPYSGPELCALSAVEAVDLLRRGAVSSAELIAAAETRHAETDPAINAMPTPCFDRARAAADRLEAPAEPRGALRGLPVGIKDLSAVAGVRCTWGTPALADYVPAESDPLVELIERRGGVVLGKTNTPEFGAGANTFNAIFGATRNPWDTRLNPAGSSGGAAAQLAVGQAWLSHGSDHGGSLRTPAAYCGVVGLRPSPGLVAGGPAQAGYITEGVQGPMARSVTDCALFLDAMTGFDPRYPLSFPRDPTPYQEAVARAEPNGLRIGYMPDMSGESAVDPDVREHLGTAMDRMARAGASVDAVTPDLSGMRLAYYVQRGLLWATLMRDIDPNVRAGFKPTLEQNVQDGLSLSMDDIVDAQLIRSRLYDELQTVFARVDVLACPVVGCMPHPVEEEWVRRIEGRDLEFYMDWLDCAFLATAVGLPAMSVPVGRNAAGLPVGLQLIGKPRGEAGLLAAARAVEQVFGGPMPVFDPVVRHD
ncbi:amidase family protein [Psychromarinibacter sp. C21-152]|uniref:Amidase family protein n=1 Tax=Psychromarinibacter sediminicola TaxID=3033385 RepID=A0AAE3NVG3_9RHOB|nr:amidase family protein [Psychromarinibacter sediminicola]MDF0603004.1 amidase family protein [Psychromarinibacter sediminicola]